ncbi:hypothetical protein ABZ726_37235, partial [Streptomyces hundungensis]
MFHRETPVFHRPAFPRRRTAAGAVLALVLALTAGTPPATPNAEPGRARVTSVDPAPGSTTALAGFAIRSTAREGKTSPAAMSGGTVTIT